MKKITLQLCLLLISFSLFSCNTETNTPPTIPDDVIISDEEGDKAKLVVGYLTAGDWDFGTAFQSVKWEYLTHINVSFLHVKADGEFDHEAVSNRIDQIKAVAKEHDIKVCISLNSAANEGFAVAIADEATRTKLVENVLAYVKKHDLDGIDVDYEIYDEIGPNLVAFVKELWEKKDKKLLQTSAVATWNPGEGYSTDWHKYFDYIHLMTYDFTGGWTDEGPHATYEDAIGVVDMWHTELEAPLSKLVLGLPFYGYSWDDIPNVDDVKAIRYKHILEHYGVEAEEKDQMGRTYYNGKPTLIRKCQYVKDNGLAGVMIWQILQDATEDERNLLKTVGEAIKNN